MARPTIVKELRRVCASDGSTLHFMIPSGDRRRPPSFLPVEAVPEFEGEVAWFEMERVRGVVWMTWKVIRRATDAAGEKGELD